ncbi:hypothetical protein AKJ09_02931 [Labilithrix luteola]|uniref:Uncharacterized protein n=1 Tax=Labilithrix luteola TaxID=1391654 RepID=A0A0K1PRX9_9BACT|nr:hypothetical protein AKJ09_02931 [Labilithrix luteola]
MHVSAQVLQQRRRLATGGRQTASTMAGREAAASMAPSGTKIGAVASGRVPEVQTRP